jgi:hypothetical protein
MISGADFYIFILRKQKNIQLIAKKNILYFIIIICGFHSAMASDRFCQFDQKATFLADTSQPDSSANTVQISHAWQLPPELRQISAIDYIARDKMACIQDEVGAIFIFNLDSSAIEKEISFGPPGNYKGLVIVKTDAYVACADGRIIEIKNYTSEKREVIEHGTHLTIEEEVNGLCYDRRNKRLLVTIKGKEDDDQNYKGIYAFGITDKRMMVKPAIKIDLRSRVFSNLQPRNIQTVFQPSDIDINPVTGLLYIVDGTRMQLLRMRMNENIKDLTELDKEKFIQPEGITFTPSGELFIASKGVREEPGMLFQVRLK